MERGEREVEQRRGAVRSPGVDGGRTRTLTQRVTGISGLSAEQVPDAVTKVLNVLQRRISGGVARRMTSELPYEVQEWIRQGGGKRGEAAEDFDRAGFFLLVEEELGISPQRVGPVVQGVLAAVREQVSENAARDVANQLPEQLKRLWDHPVVDVLAPDIEGVQHRDRRPVSDALRARRSMSRQTNTYLSFLRELAANAELTLEEAEDAAASVLCLLDQRLTQTEAEDLNAQLPMKLRELLLRCERHPGKPLRFDLMGMYEMVGEDLNVGSDEAAMLVEAVFAVVRARISPGEARDVASQLPADIGAVWNRAG